MKVQSRELISKRLIGKGPSSIVYETTWDGASRARKDFLEVPSDIFEREAAVLVGLDDHPNVVRTYCWTVDEESCSLVIELMDDDLVNMMQRDAARRKKLDSGRSGASQTISHVIDLQKFIEDRKKASVATTSSDSSVAPLLVYIPFNMTEALHVIVRIAEGMVFLHDRGVVHGDLKPKNVLVTPSGSGSLNPDLAFDLKVADFGLVWTKVKSRTLVSRQAHNMEMVRWRAPELWDLRFFTEDDDESSMNLDWDLDSRDGAGEWDVGVSLKEFTYDSDVFNFAITCWQVLTGEDPYSGSGLNDLVTEIPLGLRPELPPTCPEQLKDLIESCWGEKSGRPSFKRILGDLKVLQASLTGAGPLPNTDSVSNNVEPDSLVDVKKKAPSGPPLELVEALPEIVVLSCESSGSPGESSSLVLLPEIFQEIDVTRRLEERLTIDTFFNPFLYFRKAQQLVFTPPPSWKRKGPLLHVKKCWCLQEKLGKTLKVTQDIVREAVYPGRDRYREPVRLREVSKEFYLLVQKVKTFINDCSYENESDFVLAAIRVIAHKERFFQYHAELDWYVFLLKCLSDAILCGEQVSSQMLQQFDWEESRSSLDPSMIAADERDLKDLLKYWIAEPGQHQAICKALLCRLGAETDLPKPTATNLGVPRPITKELNDRDVISESESGKVYKIQWEEKLFTVKVFEICNEEENSEIGVNILENCSHPHIVNVVLAHKKARQQYLMMEWLSMDLLSYIEKNFPFPPLEVVDMILQVCEGMLYLNNPKTKMSHGDLKPSNIFVKSVKEAPDFIELQVAGFGWADQERKKGLGKYISEECTPNASTTLYRAPEMASMGGEMRKVRETSVKADIYSFALTCSCILTGREPLIEEVGSPFLPDDCPRVLASLLQRCWNSDPTQRPMDFYEIRSELRKLKANLLTSAVDTADQGATSEARQQESETRQDQELPAMSEVSIEGMTSEQLLLICASAMEQKDVRTVEQAVSALQKMSSINGEPSERLNAYFLQALLCRAGSMLDPSFPPGAHELPISHEVQWTEKRWSLNELLRFVDLTPYFRFGYIAANGAMLETFEGMEQIHILDFSTTHGMQWPTFMDCLADRVEGPPKVFRLTLSSAALPTTLRLQTSYEDVGFRLAKYARLRNVPFQFHVLPQPLPLLTPAHFNLRDGETLGVNFSLRLHYLADESIVTPQVEFGATSQPLCERNQLLYLIYSFNPVIVTLYEEDCNATSTDVVKRVQQSFAYEWMPFDFLATFWPSGHAERQEYEQNVGRKIENIVACEGGHRLECLESKRQWLRRMTRLGFRALQVSEDVVS